MTRLIERPEAEQAKFAREVQQMVARMRRQVRRRVCGKRPPPRTRRRRLDPHPWRDVWGQVDLILDEAAKEAASVADWFSFKDNDPAKVRRLRSRRKAA